MPEPTAASNATWLELIDCVSQYSSAIGLDAFLKVPIRAQRIERAKSSNGSNKPGAGNKNGRKSVSILDLGGEFIYSDLVEARAKVEKFDDEILRALRLRLLRQRLNDKTIERMVSILQARKKWIYKIENSDDDDKKFRIGVVSSWIRYWEDLVNLEKYFDLIGAQNNKSVEDFLSDPENQKLAARMKATLDNYGRAKNIIARTRLNKNFETMERLQEAYEPLVELSKKVGELVYDEDIVNEVDNYITSVNLFNRYLLF